MKNYAAQKRAKKKQKSWELLLEEEWGKKDWKECKQKATQLMDSLVFASSAVENANSRIKPYLKAAKGTISQERLNLIRRHLNEKVFGRGKRKGFSPAQLEDQIREQERGNKTNNPS